jgi:hypothetical protein
MDLDDPSTRPASVHPHHDALAVEVRAWFTTSSPEIDYLVEELWYGFQSNRGGPLGARLILTVDEPTQVRVALDEASRRAGRGPLDVWVDDRARCTLLEEELVLAGCSPIKSTTHLALVGVPRTADGPPSMVLDTVTDDTLEEWAVTKLKCFDDNEAAPTSDRIATERAVRQSEMALATLRLARVDGVAVGVLGYYFGSDQLVFNLGTRVPHRRRGVAQQILARWIGEGVASGCRSLMINADDPGMPQQLYRQIGFTDEIYWYRRFAYQAGPT